MFYPLNYAGEYHRVCSFNHTHPTWIATMIIKVSLLSVPHLLGYIFLSAFNACLPMTKWLRTELNRWHRDFQSLALPTELQSLIIQGLVALSAFGTPTYRASTDCSTIWATKPYMPYFRLLLTSALQASQVYLPLIKLYLPTIICVPQWKHAQGMSWKYLYTIVWLSIFSSFIKS